MHGDKRDMQQQQQQHQDAGENYIPPLDETLGLECIASPELLLLSRTDDESKQKQKQATDDTKIDNVGRCSGGQDDQDETAKEQQDPRSTTSKLISINKLASFMAGGMINIIENMHGDKRDMQQQQQQKQDAGENYIQPLDETLGLECIASPELLLLSRTDNESKQKQVTDDTEIDNVGRCSGGQDDQHEPAKEQQDPRSSASKLRRLFQKSSWKAKQVDEDVASACVASLCSVSASESEATDETTNTKRNTDFDIFAENAAQICDPLPVFYALASQPVYVNEVSVSRQEQSQVSKSSKTKEANNIDLSIDNGSTTAIKSALKSSKRSQGRGSIISTPNREASPGRICSNDNVPSSYSKPAQKDIRTEGRRRNSVESDESSVCQESTSSELNTPEKILDDLEDAYWSCNIKQIASILSVDNVVDVLACVITGKQDLQCYDYVDHLSWKGYIVEYRDDDDDDDNDTSNKSSSNHSTMMQNFDYVKRKLQLKKSQEAQVEVEEEDGAYISNTVKVEEVISAATPIPESPDSPRRLL